MSAFAAAMLSGCASQSGTCVDWVHFESDAAMAEDARLLVTGTIVDEADEIELFGEQVPVYEVNVEDVTKGNAATGDVIRVAMAPETCSGETPDPSPRLDRGARYQFYLVGAEGVADVWRTITAMQGAVQLDR